MMCICVCVCVFFQSVEHTECVWLSHSVYCGKKWALAGCGESELGGYGWRCLWAMEGWGGGVEGWLVWVGAGGWGVWHGYRPGVTAWVGVKVGLW